MEKVIPFDRYLAWLEGECDQSADFERYSNVDAIDASGSETVHFEALSPFLEKP